MPDTPLRVLYSFPHTLGRAGIAETALQQILGLARAGVRVILFCGSMGGVSLPASIEVHETMTVRGVRVPHRAVGVQRAYDWHDRVVARWIARHAACIDVVHAWPRGCLRTLRYAAARGLVALRESPNAHTASVMRNSEAATRHAGVQLVCGHSHLRDDRVLAREVAEYEAATAVLVPSDYAHGEFVAEGFPAERLLQHRYGGDLSRFSARAAERDPDRPFSVAFVGRGDPTKGLHVALDAWHAAGLEDAVFNIAGSIAPDYRHKIAGSLELPGVSALGFVDDVPALLRRADVLVLPTWTEGSALVTIEAQASGCVPLVSVAAGALGVDGDAFLQHEVGDAAALAAQLRELYTHRDQLARLSARGTASRSALSWDAAAAVLAECYRSALAADARSPQGDHDDGAESPG